MNGFVATLLGIVLTVLALAVIVVLYLGIGWFVAFMVNCAFATHFTNIQAAVVLFLLSLVGKVLFKHK